MSETWKAIPGYEGRYEVSDAGRVRSLDHRVRVVCRGVETTRMSPGRVLKPGRCRGYLIVNLSGAGTMGLHILVARAFCEGESDGREVNHKDGNKHNCLASNLEWVTKARNMEHAVDIGLNTQAIRVVHPKTGEVYPSIQRAVALTGASFHAVRTKWGRA